MHAPIAGEQADVELPDKDGEPPATAGEGETGLDQLPPPPPRRNPPAAPDSAWTVLATATLLDASPPPRIPGYEILDILDILGQGGMGRIYRARQLSLDRLVALKVIRSVGVADGEDRERFQREAHAVARLQHANVVQIHEVGEHDGRPFLVMELVDGGSLDRRVKGQALPARTAAALVERVARAVDAVHQQGLLHRDLKPANILLAGGVDRPLEECTPKVTDFGLVKRLTESEAGVTPSQTVMGTPSYMAPEQATAQTHSLGPAADVWALGAILYELLVGRPPFVGVTSVETLIQVVSDDPVPPRRLLPGVPRDLETVCMHCLRKKPADRYSSAFELAEDLRRFTEGKPVRARAVSVGERGWKWARRSPWVAGLSATLATVVIVAFAIIAWKWHDAITAAAAEEQAHLGTAAALRDARMNLYFDHIARSDLEWFADNAVRAETLLDQCPAELRRLEWDLLKRRCHDDLRTIPIGGPVNCIAFCPDGRMVTGGGDLFKPNTPGWVRVWDPHTGVRILDLPEGHTGPVTGVAVSPDGLLLASASFREDAAAVWAGKRVPPRGEVLVRNLNGDQPIRRLKGVGSVAFSPKGNYLAAPGERHGVILWDPRTGQPLKCLGDGMGRVVAFAFTPDGARLAAVTAEDKGPPALGKVSRVLRLWDVETEAQERVVGRLTDTVCNIAFSPDGRRLAAASGWRVRMWDLAAATDPVDFLGHTNDVFGLQFSPDSALLATASRDRTVKIWDVGQAKAIRTLRGHQDQVSGVAFDPVGDTRHQPLVSVGFDGLAKVWDVWAGPASGSLHAHKHVLSGLALSTDSALLATAASDGFVKVWDAHTRRLMHAFPSRETVRVAFNHQGTLLAAYGGNAIARHNPGVVRIWDPANGNELASGPRHPMLVNALAFSPDDRFLLSASGDFKDQKPGVVSLWDLAARQEVTSFRPPAAIGCVNYLAYGPDGSVVALADRTNGVWLCAADTGQEMHLFPGKGVQSFAFDRAGTRLAAGTIDGQIVIWDVAKGQELRRWQGHDGLITGMAFTADGDRLICASFDERSTRGALKIWDPLQGREVLNLPGQIHLSLARDGRRLAALAEGDLNGPGVVTIWDATPDTR